MNETLHVTPIFKNLDDTDPDIFVATQPVGLHLFTRTTKLRLA